jgi:AcrR family transcriptional regulator
MPALVPNAVDARGAKREPVRARTKTNRELHKRSVLEASAQLFLERGFAGTSMGDVAESLNISRTGLYYYFENKEQMLSALVEEVTVSINQVATSVASSRKAPDQLLHDLVQQHVMFIARNGVIFRVLTNSQMYLSDELKAVNDKAKAGIFRNFRKVIARGVDAAVFRAVDPGVAALSIIGMCNWVSSWFNPEKGLTDEQVAAEIASMAVESVRVPPADRPSRAMQRAVVDVRKSIDRLTQFFPDLP